MVDAIQVRNVTKRFGTTTAVDDLSFTVKRGEIVGFLGPNGSGKTTTMRLLTSYYTPDSGTIQIEGVDNQEHDMATRRSIGYLPENNPLYGDMVVSDYLKFISNIRGMDKKSFEQNIDQVITEAGIAEVYYRPISQLSKGYRQRTGLAASILHLPHILVMDEPTEGLDPNQRVTIRDLIKSVGGERTVLLSTHVLEEVQRTVDRLLIISRGRVVAEGTVEELQEQARGQSQVTLEVEGKDVEESLGQLMGAENIERLDSVDGRQRFAMSVAGERDIRPRVFRMAKKRNWVIWDMHEETVRLEDLFHSLTGAGAREDDQIEEIEEIEE